MTRMYEMGSSVHFLDFYFHWPKGYTGLSMISASGALWLCNHYLLHNQLFDLCQGLLDLTLYGVGGVQVLILYSLLETVFECTSVVWFVLSYLYISELYPVVVQ